jgi:hypothetical protein
MNNEPEIKSIFPADNNRAALPYATASLVLGILSIVFCFTYGIVGSILGIIGLVLANKDRNLYRINPEAYDPASYKNSNAGRTCAIIGLILSIVMFLFFLCIIIFAVSMSTFPRFH